MAKVITPKTETEWAIVQMVTTKRKELGLSQGQFGDILGVSRGFIGQIEMAKYPSMYSFDHLNVLAKTFECSIRDFIPEKTI